MSNNAYVQSVLSQHFVPIREGLDQADTVELMANIMKQLTTPGVKTVSVIGGAASGKSTIAEELVKCLCADGVATDILSTDDYVVGDRDYRQVKLKDADAQKKYDFSLMDQHTAAIRGLADEKQSVTVPVIDPETGVAVDADTDEQSREINKVDVLVVEGDFPRDDYDIRFYIHLPDGQRLQNNIERELEQKDDVDAGKLTETFNDRQRTLHKPYTLSALQSADYVLVADASDNDWLYTMCQRSY